MAALYALAILVALAYSYMAEYFFPSLAFHPEIISKTKEITETIQPNSLDQFLLSLGDLRFVFFTSIQMAVYYVFLMFIGCSMMPALVTLNKFKFDALKQVGYFKTGSVTFFL